MRVKSGKSGRSRLEKSLDGWQLGLTVVLAAWAMAMLIVPRPASPLELPLPTLRPAELAELRAVEAKREANARGELSPAVRTLGSAVRAMGRAEGSGSSTEAAAAHHELEVAIDGLRAEAPEGILALRALQTATFIRAVRDAEATGVVSRDLTELGGGLLDTFRATGWAKDAAGRPKLLMNDDELGAAYRKRWNAVVALKRGVGEPSLAEEKLLFAFAVEHPPGAGTAADPSAARVLGTRTILRRIDEYSRLDPEYPADFARGVAHFGAMAFANAQVAFNRHLAAHPDGPLTLRARNFARAAFVADAEGFVP